MALRAVPEHPKFFALKDALHIRKYHALGILEALWHFAGKFAPRGNVGKFKDSEIEGWLEWDGERGALVAALTDVGWLDKSEEHRLVIHDWHEHADQTTRKQLSRTKTAFVSDMSGQVPDMSRQNGKVSGPPEPVPGPVPVPEVSKTTSSHPGASLGAVAKHPDFAIYEAYPRKEGKGAAMEAIRKAVARLVKGEEPHPPMAKIEAQRHLMRRVLEYERSPVGRQPDKTKIPHPATWFNQKRYDDDQSNWRLVNGEGNGNRNQSKTGGNINAAAQAIAFLEQEERNREAADESELAETGGSEPGDAGAICGGLGALGTGGPGRGVEGVVIEATR